MRCSQRVSYLFSPSLSRPTLMPTRTMVVNSLTGCAPLRSCRANGALQPFVVPARKCRGSTISSKHSLDSHKLGASVTPELPSLFACHNDPNPQSTTFVTDRKSAIHKRCTPVSVLELIKLFLVFTLLIV